MVKSNNDPIPFCFLSCIFMNILIFFLLFNLGNCLELSANGILNHVSCQNFTGKCPDTSYFSDKIYECRYRVLYFFCTKSVKNYAFQSLIKPKSQLVVYDSTRDLNADWDKNLCDTSCNF